MKSDKNGSKKYWSAAEGSFCCLIDQERTLAFRKSIEGVVKKDDIVVDIGAGTGILSLFAAQSGARRIYAIESDDRNIKMMKNNFRFNGFEDCLKIINDDATKVKLPEKVDVIICEMIATGLIEELQIPAMNNILKYRKKKSKILLKKYKSFVDLVKNNNYFYNFKLNIFRFEYPGMKELRSLAYSRKINYLNFDFSRFNKLKKINKRIKIKINKNGIINAIRISGETIFCTGKTFNESPAYSFPILLPIDETKVIKGDDFVVNLSYMPCNQNGKINYSINKINKIKK